MSASTELRLLRELAPRLLLAAVPFVAWFIWREVARRSGRPMGSTPWAWLVGAAGLLLGLSLLATAVFHDKDRGGAYVPAEVEPGGHVTPGHFERKAPGK